MFQRVSIIRDISPLKKITRSEYDVIDLWNERMQTSIRNAYEEYNKTRSVAARAYFDEKLALFIYGYNQNCMLDIDVSTVAREKWMPEGKWALSQHAGQFAMWPSDFAEKFREYATRDVFGLFILRYWTHPETDIEIANEILRAFERLPGVHRLFSNVRRMAVLLVAAFLLRDNDREKKITILISYLSDDAWREMAALAIGDAVAERVDRAILIRYCWAYGSHALNQSEIDLLLDRYRDCRAVINEERAASVRDKIFRDIEEFIFTAPIETLLRDANRSDIPDLMVEFPPNDTGQYTLETLNMPIRGTRAIADMFRRAAKRLCKGEIYRTTLGLVNQGGGLDLGYLPTYAILRIVERALPDCIFTHDAGDSSGLLAEYEVVPIIEAVVKFARGVRNRRMLEQPFRAVRSRTLIDTTDDDDDTE